MSSKILIALPPAMLLQLDKIAFAEHRTRSDLMREMGRRYIATFSEKHDVDSIKLPAKVTRPNGTRVYPKPSQVTPAQQRTIDRVKPINVDADVNLEDEEIPDVKFPHAHGLSKSGVKEPSRVVTAELASARAAYGQQVSEWRAT